MSRITFIAALFAISSLALAGSPLSFPDASEIVGVDLPKISTPLIKRQYEDEVLKRFDVERSYLSQLTYAIKGWLLINRESICGNSLGREKDFLADVIFKGKYDQEIFDLLDQSDAILKLRLYLSYRSGPSPGQFAELKAIPVNDLSRGFVATWVSGDFIEGSRTRLNTAAVNFLKKRCAS